MYPKILVQISTTSKKQTPYQAVRSGLFDADRHLGGGSVITGRSGDGDSTSSDFDGNIPNSVTCPKPIYELILVSSSISILILTVAILLRILIRHLRDLLLLDIIFYALSAVLLLIGCGFFFHCAYHISEWCSIKARLYSSGYFVHNMLLLQSDLSLAGRPTAAPGSETSGGDVGGLARVLGIQNEMAPLPHDIDGHVAMLHKSVVDYDEMCHLTHLIEEKYWAAVSEQ